MISRTGWKGLLASSALIGVMVVVSDGCSGDSGNNNAAMDAGEEPMHPDVIVHHEAAAPSDTGGGSPLDVSTVDTGTSGPVDGTTGKQCKMDSDCTGPGGPGLNLCSISGVFVDGPLNPTPVCLSPAPCDLGTGVNVTFCDGSSPSDSTSPGVCLPGGSGATGVTGRCYPMCTIPSDGSAPTGCQGKNRCNLYATLTDATGKVSAIGFCLGGCAADSDCPSGSKCQKDEGFCVTTPATATKQLGQTCSANDLGTGTSNYRCNCFYQPTTMIGYCSQFCITGPSSSAPCPSGYVCDPQLPTMVPGQNNAMVTGFTKVNPGLAGYCLQACGTASAPATDAGAEAAADAMSGDGEASEGGSSTGVDAQASVMCPLTAGCTTQNTAGPDCTP